MRIHVLASIALISTPLWGQQSANSAPVLPQVTVSAHGETRVSPDRATIQISVQTRAATAAAAATENAAKQKAVFDALRALGIPNDQLSTINYNVYPEQRYEPNKEPVIVGYNVTNTLLVDVRKLSLVGPVIDAALSKGANMITSLQFYASNTEEARRAAIASAVQKARADAEAAARAAGGTLGNLLEITVGTFYAPPPRPMAMARDMAGAVAAQETPINPGEQTVSVDLTTRWAFIAGNR
ncbi:MAG TPA: SIMPL domain-containing protein [Gemmatimonadaceae bacterium]